MNNQKRTPYFLILALLTAGYFMMSPVAKAADTSVGDSEQVSKLFSEAKTEADGLVRDAELLDVFTRSVLSWDSHATQISLIREHVNKAGQILTSLNEVRHTGSPWQQQAIDQITPLLKELASNTQSAIEHLNEKRDDIRFRAGQYQDYAVANYNLASELAALISHYVDYERNKAEFARLGERRLEVAEN
ncbi:MAG TPA: hypothetical protein VKM93_19110 [Terriglobia bacterium]|nr:hypothetical protein [Terriglobia bacterium]